MQGKSIALGLLAFAQGALAADGGELSLGVGFNYSSGEYGTSTTTEILSIPIIARYERGPWIFKLTVPYLSIPGGTSVVPGGGRVTSSNPRRRDRKSTRLNSSHRCISYAVFCLKKKK